VNLIMLPSCTPTNWWRLSGAVPGCVLTGFPLAPVTGQSSQSVLRATTCAACRIEVARLFTLDNGSDNDLLEDWPSSIAMDSHGRIALAIAGGKGLAVLYDSLGRAPSRIGRVGSGPNEYRWPAAVAFGAGDTLHVFDLGLSRRTELLGNVQPARLLTSLFRQHLLR